MAVGETDPTCPGLLEALKQARSQAQVRPVGDRITSTESFLERAKKRVVGARQEVEKARDALTSAETKLVLEEDAVRQAEERLLLLRQEASGLPGSPPATVPADFVQELARLRELVQDLQRERDDLRSELADQGNHAGEDGRWKKSLRSDLCPFLQRIFRCPC